MPADVLPGSARARRECLLAGLAACALAAGLATVLGPAWRVTGSYAPAATGSVALMMGTAAAALGPRAGVRRFGAANAVTSLRAVLTGLVIGLVPYPIGDGAARGAVVLGLAAVILDGVDGALARSGGTSSRFGARFDMEVDALLILGLSVLVFHAGKAGAWVAASGLLRYAFVAAGWAQPWLTRPLEPSRRRQTVCVVQIAGLLIALDPAVPPATAGAVAALALAALVWSFALDVRWLFARR